MLNFLLHFYLRSYNIFNVKIVKINTSVAKKERNESGMKIDRSSCPKFRPRKLSPRSKTSYNFLRGLSTLLSTFLSRIKFMNLRNALSWTRIGRNPDLSSSIPPVFLPPEEIDPVEASWKNAKQSPL